MRPSCCGAICWVLLLMTGETANAQTRGVAVALNDTAPTLCAEEDNVNVPLVPPGHALAIESFVVEATHPLYDYDAPGTSAPDFTNCHITPANDFPFANPGELKIYDDGDTVIVAVREALWWRPQGMTVSGELGALTDAHRFAVHRRVGESDYPQVLVFHEDGNLRLKPQPPTTHTDVFGSSVVIGPAERSARPFAAVESVHYDSARDALDVVYAGGGTASMFFEEVTRERTRLRVEADFATPDGTAFAVFRSMFVEDGNSDADRVAWTDPLGATTTAPVLDFTSATGSDFFFHREVASRHNTSAPDIRLGEFRYAVVPELSSLALAIAAAALAVLGIRRWGR